MAQILSSIAIVDDDPFVLKALARLLAAHSFIVRTYQSGPQFLAELPEGKPDCLIVDLQMPEMTGFDLQQNLIRKGLLIPTIIITAHDEAGGSHRLSVEAGARHVAVCRD